MVHAPFTPASFQGSHLIGVFLNVYGIPHVVHVSKEQRQIYTANKEIVTAVPHAARLVDLELRLSRWPL